MRCIQIQFDDVWCKALESIQSCLCQEARVSHHFTLYWYGIGLEWIIVAWLFLSCPDKTVPVNQNRLEVSPRQPDAVRNTLLDLLQDGNCLKATRSTKLIVALGGADEALVQVRWYWTPSGECQYRWQLMPKAACFESQNHSLPWVMKRNALEWYGVTMFDHFLIMSINISLS